MQPIGSKGRRRRILRWASTLVLLGLAACAGKGHWGTRQGRDPAVGQTTEESKEQNRYFYFLRGYRDGLQGETDAAIDAYEKAIELDSSSPYLHLSLARLYLKTGRPEDALREAQRVVSLDPDHADGYSLLAGIYSASNRIEEAIEAYQRVLELDADREKTRIFLSSLYATSREYDKAVEILQ